MSGTSWFDLTAIQDQINKSIQEAAKIAEEASKYDILNFDGMAELDEDEEREYDSEEEEFLQIASNGDADANYVTKTKEESPDIGKKLFSDENRTQTPVALQSIGPSTASIPQNVKIEPAFNKSMSFDFDDNDIFSTVVNGQNDINCQKKGMDAQLPSPSLIPSIDIESDYKKEKLEDGNYGKELFKGLESSLPIVPHDTKPLRPTVQHVPSTPLSSISGISSPDSVSNPSFPQNKTSPFKNTEGVQKLASNSDSYDENESPDIGSNFEEISLNVNTVDIAENNEKAGNVDIAVPSSSRPTGESVLEVVQTEGIADDFFGDQFNNINTTKKEKQTPSSTFSSQSESSTVTKSAPSSSSAIREPIVNDEGGSPPSHLKVKGATSFSQIDKSSDKKGKANIPSVTNNKGILQIAEKKKDTVVEVSSIENVKKKGRKKKKEKGW